MTYKFVTREEIEKIKADACAAGDPSHLIVPLVALLEALKFSLRILAERDAYREITQYRCEECCHQNFSYPLADAEAARILTQGSFAKAPGMEGKK